MLGPKYQGDVMRFKQLVTGAGLLAGLSIAMPAAAELSYNFVEVGGYPFLQSPKVRVGIRDLLGVKQPANVQVEGWAVGFDIAYEFNEYWHAFSRYNYTESNTNVIKFEGTLGGKYAGVANISQHAFTIGPGLHVAMSEKTDVVLELGLLYTQPHVTLVGALTLPDFSGGSVMIPIDIDDKESQYGILGRAGIRHLLYESLELFGYMASQSSNLTTNNIFWELGGIYSPIESMGLSASVDVGTDGNVGVRLALRYYYDRFLKKK